MIDQQLFIVCSVEVTIAQLLFELRSTFILDNVAVWQEQMQYSLLRK